MEFTDEHKKNLEMRFIGTIISGLEQGQLQVGELHELAEAILTRIDHIKNHEELVTFLRDLTHHWPVFQPILESEQLNQHIRKG